MQGYSMRSHYRLIILGAGTAGLSAFKEARRHTDDILLVDPGPLGTTCARVGCMPSKALLQIAHEVHASQRLRRQQLLGGTGGDINSAAVMTRVRELRDRFAAGPKRSVEALGERFVRAAARFVSADTLDLEGRHVSADAIIVATGSQPLVPAEWHLLPPERLLTSDSLFELKSLPRRIGVIGLGPIGLELGQALARLGVEVHLFGRSPRIAGLNDSDVNAVAFAAMQSELAIHIAAEVHPEVTGSGIRLRADEESIEVDAVLLATGRRPNLAGLGLECLGLELDQHGRPAFDHQRLRVGTTSIYFAGDVSGIAPLMHEAADEGRLAAYHALHPEARCLARRTPLAIVFTSPQIARVGSTPGELPQGHLVGRSDFNNQGRALIVGQGGLLHVYADAQGRLLGAEMFTPGGEHLAHQLAWLVQLGITAEQALQLPFYHPVLEEGLRTALQDLRRQLPERERRPDLPLCGALDDPLPGV